MQLTLLVLFSLILPNAGFPFEDLLFNTNYGKIQFYSKPAINSISGEFSSRDTNSIKIIFLSRVTDEKREISLTDAYKNIIIKYVATPHGIVYIQIRQFNFIGHMTRDNILHLPITEIPDINGDDYQLHLDLYKNIEKLGMSNTTVQHALSLAFLMQEFELVEALSRSLAEVFDSRGRDYPSVMAIYLTSRTLINTKTRIINAIENNNETPLRETRDSECIVEDGFQGKADVSSCHRSLVGKDCKGLCGPGNLCWNFICGDCCYHKGCADHDNCCDVYGMANLKCMLPTRFSCEGYSCN